MRELTDKERRRVRELSVTLADIEEQHAKGWVDFHPEDYCHRCGGRNACWWVDSPIWNTVMDYPNEKHHGIVCPPCFMELAEGVAGDWTIKVTEHGIWRLVAGWIDARKLVTRHIDGRTYDWEVGLWRDDAPEPWNGEEAP